MSIISSFVSGIQKCHLFLSTKLEMPKVAFQKGGVITFTFFTIAQPKINIALESGTLVVCMYSPFFFKFGPHSKIQLENNTSFIRRLTGKTDEISFAHFAANG